MSEKMCDLDHRRTPRSGVMSSPMAPIPTMIVVLAAMVAIATITFWAGIGLPIP